MRNNRTPEAARAELLHLMGKLPDVSGNVGAELLWERDMGSYTLEYLILDLNGIEPVPAYFTKPKSAVPPYRTVLFNHSHGGLYELGKNELIYRNPRGYVADPPYGEALAGIGVAALAIDHWAFGERRGRTESETFKEFLWNGQVMWGMMVFDSIRAVDYLEKRSDVRSGSIGTLGMSMGSTMAWWLAAVDERIAACVDICCLTDFHELINARGLDGHGIYYYVPDLLNHFTTGEINALIAPRPHLSFAGNYDDLTPIAGLDKIDAYLKTIYEGAGCPEKWRLTRYNVSHVETQAMRAEALRFLDLYLEE